MSFAGGDRFVYRLTMTTGGFVDLAFPPAASRQRPTEVELCGWNILPSQARRTLPAAGERDRLVAFAPEFASWGLLSTVDQPLATEHEPNDLTHAQAVSWPGTVCGRIGVPGDIDVYSFTAKRGQQWEFRVFSRALGFPLDPLLKVWGPRDQRLVKIDDTSGQRDAETIFKVPDDGVYRVSIEDLTAAGSPRHVYRLDGGLLEPDFSLRLAADRFEVKAGQSVEVPITVTRRHGFADPIVMEAIGLPTGLSAAPVTSEPKGATAAAVTMKLTAATTADSGPFEIAGKSSARSHRAEAPIPDLNGWTANTTRPWISVSGATKAAEPAKAAKQPSQ